MKPGLELVLEGDKQFSMFGKAEQLVSDLSGYIIKRELAQSYWKARKVGAGFPKD